MQPQQARL